MSNFNLVGSIIAIILIVVVVTIFVMIFASKKRKKHDSKSSKPEEKILVKASHSSSSSSESCDTMGRPVIDVYYANDALHIFWMSTNAYRFDIHVKGTDNPTDIKIKDFRGYSTEVPVGLGIYVVYVTPRGEDCYGPTGASSPIVAKGDPCTTDNDCDPGQVCGSGTCQPGCNPTHLCPRGETCVEGECLFGCTVQTDCPYNTYCLGNECVEGCLSDTNCQIGEICQGGICIPGCTTLCPEGQHCSGGSCQPGCVSDSNCGGNTPHCNTNTDQCVECNTNGQCSGNTPYCYQNTCVNCVSDNGCPLGEICNGNTCVPGCRSNANCPSNEPVCYGGNCVECTQNSDCNTGFCGNNNTCVNCLVDTDCPIGTYCNNGNCVQGCHVDSNCAVGEYCNNGNCIPGCQNDNNCPPNLPHCSNSNCVQCISNPECGTDASCIAGSCNCPIPSVTSISLSSFWPTPSPWTFTFANASGTPLISFAWEVVGTVPSGAITGPLSGYYPMAVPLANNQFTANAFPQLWSCNSQFQYGCPGSCPSNYTVTFKISQLVVKNACGAQSAPTCWQVNPCNSLSFTQVPC